MTTVRRVHGGFKRLTEQRVPSVLWGSLIICLMYMFVPSSVESAEDVPRIPKEEVKALLGAPGVFILDARIGSTWSGSESMVKGAVRADPDDIASWVNGISKDKKVIVYCS